MNFLLLFLLHFASCRRPLVNTPLGSVKGHYKRSYENRIFSAFEGIPYAKPPLGYLRFKEPQNIEPWPGILDATTIYECIQIKTHNYQVDGDEDCLYLNVYVPRENPSSSEKLDVIVYIHGGAFMFGDTLQGGPEFLMDRDIIYIALNYRVGIIGFLSTEDNVVPGNNGLKDQVLALQWIKNNVKYFGGNPDSVTLIGLSAGGSSVHFHYFSPLSDGLFHRGISQSGTALVPWALQEAPLEKARKLAELVGCNHLSTKEFVVCLQSRSAKHLVQKTTEFFAWNEYPLSPFAPVIEKKSNGAFLTKHPFKLLKDGQVKDIPWITSVTAEEGIFPVITFIDKLAEVDENWNEIMPYLLEYNYTVSDADKNEVSRLVKHYYFENQKPSDNIESLIQLFGDRFFVIDFEKTACLQAKVTKSPVYTYIYAYKGERSLSNIFKPEDYHGVAHGEDGYLLYNVTLFGNVMSPKKLTVSDKSVKEILVNMLVSFAKDGIPVIRNESWKRITNCVDFAFLRFDKDPDNIKMDYKNLTPAIEFWNSLPIFENENIFKTKDEL